MFNSSSANRKVVSIFSLMIFVGLMFSLAACADEEALDSAQGETSSPTMASTNLVLASTTSTQDSGLFDVLVPAFEGAHPEINVQVIAVGSGEAMEMGRRGDADLLLAHSPAVEITFMEEGYGLERSPVMYNDFVLVGPEDDPADAASAANAAEALRRIANTESTFISRGDDSGTHAREMSIWNEAGIQPEGDWYEKSGQGMGATLLIAEELFGYTISDRATYLTLSNEGAITMPILSEGSAELLNFYHVITLIDAREQEAAQAFTDWIISPAGQEVIASFGIETFGVPLFTPNADE